MIKKLFWAVSLTIATVAYYCWLGPRMDDVRKTPSRATSVSPPAAVSSRMSPVPQAPRGGPLPSWPHYIQQPWQTCDSFLEVRTSGRGAYVLKLVDPRSKRAVLSYYIPGGTTQEIEVPSGTYEIRYTTGSEWFGDAQLFGPTAHYAKANRTFQFTRDSGYELTLYAVPHGNLGTTPIRPQDF